MSQSSSMPVPLRRDIAIRGATPADLPFIDSLQKQHAKQVGWMPTKQLEGKIERGHVIVAEEGPSTSSGQPASPVGYCIGTDQYFKRDDVGIIYQMNVVPDRQRGLIGATLVRAMFNRAAYGCKLFCCWCAQDIAANRFWESLGFVPLAFRAGSRDKGRVHIFWQRRIRAGDATTPYWFPSQTTSGSIREDRLVFPIPPGTHWSNAKPIILPATPVDEPKGLPAARQKKPKGAAIKPSSLIASGGLRFVVPKAPESEPKPKCEPRRKVKNDPRLVAAARELRDRWLERVNADPTALPIATAKYQLCKTPANSVEPHLEAAQATPTPTPLLEAA